MDMERNIYTHLQIYILVITFMCYKHSAGLKNPSEVYRANLALLKSVKLISFHLASLWQQSR